jgi:broad specificity phosphatase PhoE
MHLLDMPARRRSPFQFDNTSLSIVSVSPQRVRLLKLNDTSHLVNGYTQG